MKSGFRQSMAWLHTWSGLLAGWVLFAVFLTGTASYLRPEITRWMRPEVAGGSIDSAASAVAAIGQFRRIAPNSPAWFIALPNARDPVTTAFWRDPPGQGRALHQAALDPHTGAVLEERATRGGEFFYRFHFQLYYLPVLWGRWVISVAAMAMLVSIISGIITHRRIFADFFTFRPRKGQRSWLDGHAAAAVLPLPYHLMITFTGLVTLMTMILPWGIGVAYGPAGTPAFFAEAGGYTAPRPAGRPGTLSDPAPMLAEAARSWNGAAPYRINVLNPADANGAVVLYRGDDNVVSADTAGIAFAGTTGAKLAQWGDASPVQQARGVMIGLHTGHFAVPVLRGLFVVAGLAGATMVATGCVLWAVKRRKAGVPQSFGHRLVDVLNIATIGGLPIAMVAFFWGNRLLPLRMEGREDWEIRVFFIAWGVALLHAAFRPRRSAWPEQFVAGAALCLLLPLVNGLTTDRHLGRSLWSGDWVMAGFDGSMLIAGAGLGVIAWLCRPARPSRYPGRAMARAAE